MVEEIILIDTHCHLDAVEFDADRDALLQKVGAGRTAWVVPAVERANFAAVSSVCRSYPNCHPAYGIHPMYVERARPCLLYTSDAA
ncbi:MAG: TatD family hydrolase, partial [Rhodocyclaceae bacterium]|nr:TatD family hydrolase [Rhodocyclaceae bacterium]